MSDIRFNRWLHQSGTGGVSQDSSGNIGIGSTQPLSALDLGTGNIRSHNIHSTGIVTTIGLDINGNADISGNLNVGGVLTYEDVTNIDSVGIITARAGVNVTGGSVGIGTDNPTTALEVKGDITVYNTNNQGDIFFGEHGDVSDSKALIRMDQVNSTNGELQFHTEGSGTLAERLRITSDGYARLTTANARLEWTASSGSNPFIRSIGSGQQELEFNTGGSERLRITSDGKIGINETNPQSLIDVKSEVGPHALGVVLRKDFNGPVADTVSKLALTLWGQDHDDGTSGSSTDQYGPMIGFGIRNDDGVPNVGDIRAGISYSYNGNLTFHTKSGSPGVADGQYERLRIDSNGRILKGIASSILGGDDIQLQGSGGPATVAGYKSDNNPTANSSMLTVTGYSQSGSTFTGIGAIDFRVDQISNTSSGHHPGSIVMRVNGGSTTGTHGGYSYSYAGLKDRERLTRRSKRFYCLPEYQSGSDTYNLFREQWDYQHSVGYNQYSWYRFTTHSGSGSRGGSVDIKITWSTRHAAGNGYGHYGFHWRDNHSTGYVEIGNVYKYHQNHLGGSFYGWNGSPQLDVYEVNDNGNVAGFYLRVQGHMNANSGTYDGGVMHQFTINAHTNRYGADVNKFEFVGNSTPSDVGSIQGNINP